MMSQDEAWSASIALAPSVVLLCVRPPSPVRSRRPAVIPRPLTGSLPAFHHYKEHPCVWR